MPAGDRSRERERVSSISTFHLYSSSAFAMSMPAVAHPNSTPSLVVEQHNSYW